MRAAYGLRYLRGNTAAPPPGARIIASGSVVADNRQAPGLSCLPRPRAAGSRRPDQLKLSALSVRTGGMTDQTAVTTIASTLRRARERLALDQDSLAQLANVPLATIEQADLGELTKLDAVAAERLAGTLGIKTEELLR